MHSQLSLFLSLYLPFHTHTHTHKHTHTHTSEDEGGTRPWKASVGPNPCCHSTTGVFVCVYGGGNTGALIQLLKFLVYIYMHKLTQYTRTYMQIDAGVTNSRLSVSRTHTPHSPSPSFSLSLFSVVVVASVCGSTTAALCRRYGAPEMGRGGEERPAWYGREAWGAYSSVGYSSVGAAGRDGWAGNAFR